jgi:hypothetical protein
MAGEADQNPPIITEPVADDNKSDSGTESDSPTMSTSSNVAAIKIADKTVPITPNFCMIKLCQARSALGYILENLA